MATSQKSSQLHGGQSNAETGADSTMYYETVPARPADLEWALQLEADRMTNAVISDDRLVPEIDVVRNELAMDENSPGTALTERLFAAAYTWHNYGKGVGGARSDLQNLNAAEVRSFYRTYYRPDNALVVVAGKIDVPSTLMAIETLRRHSAARLPTSADDHRRTTPRGPTKHPTHARG